MGGVRIDPNAALLEGRVVEGLAAMDRHLGSVGLKLPPTRRATSAGLAQVRARLRVRGYRLGASVATDTDHARLDASLRAALGLSLIDEMRAAVLHTRHLMLALRVGARAQAARGLALEAMFLATFSDGARARALEALARAEELATETRDPLAHGLAAVARGFASASIGEWSAAAAVYAQAARALEPLPEGRPMLARLQALREGPLFYLGELGPLLRHVTRERQRSDEDGDHYTAMTMRTGLAGTLLLAHGDLPRAVAEVTRAEAEWAYGDELAHRGLLARAHIDLYAGDGVAAWRRVNDAWPALAAARLLRAQPVRVEAHHLRARCAIAAAEAGERREVRISDAEHDIGAIEREHVPWAASLARLLRAAVARLRGDDGATRAWLRAAEGDFERCGMALHLAIARRATGAIVGGGRGAELIASGDRWLRDHGVVEPTAFASMLAPGLGSSFS